MFGGTWQQIEGAFLLAANTEYPAGTTGGEAEHQLTVSEMPEHLHNPTNAAIGWVDYGDSSTPVTKWWLATANNEFLTFRLLPSVRGALTTWSGESNGGEGEGLGPIMLNTGSSQPHNNMPPYLSVYMWKRIA